MLPPKQCKECVKFNPVDPGKLGEQLHSAALFVKREIDPTESGAATFAIMNAAIHGLGERNCSAGRTAFGNAKCVVPSEFQAKLTEQEQTEQMLDQFIKYPGLGELRIPGTNEADKLAW